MSARSVPPSHRQPSSEIELENGRTVPGQTSASSREARRAAELFLAVDILDPDETVPSMTRLLDRWPSRPSRMPGTSLEPAQSRTGCRALRTSPAQAHPEGPDTLSCPEVDAVAKRAPPGRSVASARECLDPRRSREARVYSRPGDFPASAVGDCLSPGAGMLREGTPPAPGTSAPATIHSSAPTRAREVPVVHTPHSIPVGAVDHPRVRPPRFCDASGTPAALKRVDGLPRSTASSS